MKNRQRREPLLTPAEIAARLQVLDKDGEPHGSKILQYAREGKIPSVRLSAKCIRFDWEAVERALIK
jgi:predicted site-specific integrase-resolvase